MNLASHDLSTAALSARTVKTELATRTAAARTGSALCGLSRGRSLSKRAAEARERRRQRDSSWWSREDRDSEEEVDSSASLALAAAAASSSWPSPT